MNNPVPQIGALYNPTLDVIRALGGSGSNGEIRKKVIELLSLPVAVIDIPHRGNRSKSELDYRLGWARTHLKKSGFIDNSRMGVWSLTPVGLRTDRVDPEEVLKVAQGAPRGGSRDEGQTRPDGDNSESKPHDPVGREDVSEELSKVLQDMAPDAFERLCQRLLRESGFNEVEVTGRLGDGGIDGYGIIRLGELITEPVVFQCKRHKTAVGPGVVRDFRGAMAGRSGRGIILTTGTFTSEAEKEAKRDGADRIDLIDGELLIQRIKATKLGVKEELTLDHEFFRSI